MFLWRGLTAQGMCDANIGNEGNRAQGRNLPVHYMLPDANVQSVHAVLGTHIPQAPGTGYAYRLAGADRISVAYFGDGAASEGDALTALNFVSWGGSGGQDGTGADCPSPRTRLRCTTPKLCSCAATTGTRSRRRRKSSTRETASRRGGQRSEWRPLASTAMMWWRCTMRPRCVGCSSFRPFPRSRHTAQAARQRIIETGEPALLELMTYR